MRRKLPRVSALELRKELLIAESELNRMHLMGEWQAMSEGIGRLTTRVKSVGTFASVTAVLVAGVAAFRRGKAGEAGVKPSWFQSALKGAQTVNSLWLAFRARQQ